MIKTPGLILSDKSEDPLFILLLFYKSRNLSNTLCEVSFDFFLQDVGVQSCSFVVLYLTGWGVDLLLYYVVSCLSVDDSPSVNQIYL